MTDDTPLNECTAQKPDGAFCGRTSVPQAPFPVCYEHAGELLEFLRIVYERSAVSGGDFYWITLLAGASPTAAATPGVPAAPRPPVVYYLLVDGIIKIGTTSDLKRRMAAYPPTAELLATEPGSYDIEAARHRRFAKYRCAGNEWFSPSATLMAYIEELRSAAA